MDGEQSASETSDGRKWEAVKVRSKYGRWKRGAKREAIKERRQRDGLARRDSQADGTKVSVCGRGSASDRACQRTNVSKFP